MYVVLVYVIWLKENDSSDSTVRNVLLALANAGRSVAEYPRFSCPIHRCLNSVYISYIY